MQKVINPSKPIRKTKQTDLSLSSFANGNHRDSQPPSINITVASKELGSYHDNIQNQIERLNRYNGKAERLINKLQASGDKEKRRRKLSQVTQVSKSIVRKLLNYFRALNADLNNEMHGFQQMEEKQRERKDAKLLIDSFESSLSRFIQLSQRYQRLQRSDIISIEQAIQNKPTVAEQDYDSFAQEQDKRSHNQTEQDIILQSRQEELRKIEKDISEICDMFNDIQTLINEQQEAVESIEAQIYQTHRQVGRAREQLRIAEDSQARRRRRNCCILLFLVFAISLFIYLLVGQ